MIALSSVWVALIIGCVGISFYGYTYRWIALQLPIYSIRQRVMVHLRPPQVTLIRLMGGGILTVVMGYASQLGIGLAVTFLIGWVTAWILQVVLINPPPTRLDATIDQQVMLAFLASLGMSAISLMIFSAMLIGLTIAGFTWSSIAQLLIAYCFGMVISIHQTEQFILNWVNLMITALATSMLIATQTNLTLPYLIFPLFIFSTGLLLSLGEVHWVWTRSYEQVSQLLAHLRLTMLGGYGLLMGLIVFGGLLFFEGVAFNTLGAMLSGVLAGFLLIFGLPISHRPDPVSQQDGVLTLSDNFVFVRTTLILLGLLLASSRFDGVYGMSLAMVGLLAPLLILLVIDKIAPDRLSDLQYLIVGCNALVLCIVFLQISQLISADGLFLSSVGLSKLIVGFVLGGGLLGWLIIESMKITSQQDQNMILFDVVWTVLPSLLMILTVLGMGNILGEIVGHETTFGFLCGFTSAGWFILILLKLPTFPRQMIFQSLQWIPLLAVMLSFWV